MNFGKNARRVASVVTRGEMTSVQSGVLSTELRVQQPSSLVRRAEIGSNDRRRRDVVGSSHGATEIKGNGARERACEMMRSQRRRGKVKMIENQ